MPGTNNSSNGGDLAQRIGRTEDDSREQRIILERLTTLLEIQERRLNHLEEKVDAKVETLEKALVDIGTALLPLKNRESNREKWKWVVVGFVSSLVVMVIGSLLIYYMTHPH